MLYTNRATEQQQQFEIAWPFYTLEINHHIYHTKYLDRPVVYTLSKIIELLAHLAISA